MKWLSVKTYVPSTSCELFIRINKNSDQMYQYERCLIASIGSFKNISDLKDIRNWELSANAITDDYLEFYVTHFAIIDAVEWE